MAHKRYTIADDTYARLQTGISATTTTINISPPSESWARNFAGNNTIATLAQYDNNGNISKKEKVYITGISGNVLTVSRGYLGDTPQSFNNGDYIFLNIVAEHIDDIHTRIDEVEADVEQKRGVLQGQIDDIYSEGNRRLRVYRLADDPPLQVRVGAGSYRIASTYGIYRGGSVILPNNKITSISLNINGEVILNDNFDDELIRLARVTTNGGRIISIELWKMDVIGGKLNSGISGFENISNIRYKQGLIYSFMADGINYTLNRKNGLLTNVSNGENIWNIQYSGGKLISIIKS